MWAWSWDFDGKKILKVEYALKFERFRGTKPITDLPFYPVSSLERGYWLWIYGIPSAFSEQQLRLTSLTSLSIIPTRSASKTNQGPEL